MKWLAIGCVVDRYGHKEAVSLEYSLRRPDVAPRESVQELLK